MESTGYLLANTMKIKCQNIYKTFSSLKGDIPALENVNINVPEQEFVTIVGPSGCGKTTLLKLIAGLIKPSSGHILFGFDKTDGRPDNAMVFQEHGLFPWLTVLENIAFGLEMQNIDRKERTKRANEFIDQKGLTDFRESYPYQLSAGMRQKVAIARAFVAEPHILLMDEPFSSLDAQTTLVLQQELLDFWKNDNQTVVYVTHDIEEAILLSDRVLVMSGRPGTIIKEIPVSLPRPRNLINNDYHEVKESKWRIWKMLENEVKLDI